MEEYPKPEQHWFDADKNSGSEPSKKTKKEPTGILKGLLELKKYDYVWIGSPLEGDKNGRFVLWSDVEAIINKYLNP